MFSKILRVFLLTVVGIASFLVIFILFAVGPVDRRPASGLAPYETTLSGIKDLHIEIPKADTSFLIGFGKENITPSEPLATAGYGKRKAKPYHLVHDSIYVSAMVVTNGVQKVAIVSADLLIMPPTVTRVLERMLPEIGFSLDNTYLGATHSHNSIGHWGEGATRFIYGVYEDSVVQFIANGIVNSIRKAHRSVMASRVKTGAIALPQAVKNRLIDGGPEDPYLRVIEVERSDGSKGALLSYTAHATCLSQATLELSRDYPGMVVDAVENSGYSFAMFMAGSVGSHTTSAPGDDWSCMAWMAENITAAFYSGRANFKPLADTALIMRRVPISLSDPQVKLTEHWKLRAWVFRAAFGEYDAFLTVFRFGDLIMLGTPCDFSGELNASLDSLAAERGVSALVTSFNGGYIGYMTPGKYYSRKHYETQVMNWYAPGTGDYLQECMKHLMIAVTDTK